MLYGKVFANRGYIKQELFESLFSQGVQLVHCLKAKIKNKLMPMWDKIMLRKRYIIEYMNTRVRDKVSMQTVLTALIFQHKQAEPQVYCQKSNRLLGQNIGS